MKLLVIIEDKFKDVELVTPLTIFKTSNQFNQIDFYNPKLSSATGKDNLAHINKILNNVDIDQYDLIFIPGGPGAQDLRKNIVSLNLVRKHYDAGKPIVAICDAPNVLTEAKVIKNQEFASYPSLWSNNLRKDNWISNLVSYKEDKLITGNSPYASAKLAFITLIKLFGYKVALDTYKSYAGKPDATEIVL